MANKIIKIPRSYANDEQVKIIELNVQQHAPVSSQQVIAVLEGSKAIFELVSPYNGFINLLYSEGDFINIDDTFAEVADNIKKFTLEKNSYLTTSNNDNPENFTVPAFTLLKSLNIPANVFAQSDLVTTADINEYQTTQLLQLIDDSTDVLTRDSHQKKIVIVGAGKAAGQLLSIFHTQNNTQVLGFVDDTEEKRNTQHMGYPVLGKINDVERVIKEHKANAIICSSGNLSLRQKVIKLACELKLTLANAIHPSVVFDENTHIGTGNYIGPNCFIGTNAKVGFGNFISSNSIIEHDCTLQHCITTGPSVSLSGSVSIGSNCVLGSGIIIEPYVDIGAGSKLASGCIITQNIPPNSTLKMKTNYTLS